MCTLHSTYVKRIRERSRTFRKHASTHRKWRSLSSFFTFIYLLGATEVVAFPFPLFCAFLPPPSPLPPLPPLFAPATQATKVACRIENTFSKPNHGHFINSILDLLLQV